MTRVKICGITNLEDAQAAVELGADALGFVFAESPRRISRERAAEIICSLPPFLTCVGLFVEKLPQIVREIIKECSLNALQFHGRESSDYCRQFRINPVRSNSSRTDAVRGGGGVSNGVKIIKAFRLRDEHSLKTIPYYQVDAYLLDTYVEGASGGTGQSFNWDLALRAREFGRPIILAGGLRSDNLVEAIGKVKPYGVDVSTGVEAEPGKKDHKKMKEFIRIVRSAG